jgi:hypothetical protein
VVRAGRIGTGTPTAQHAPGGFTDVSEAMDRAFNPWRYDSAGRPSAEADPHGSPGGTSVRLDSAGRDEPPGPGGPAPALKVVYPPLERAADTYPLYDRLSRGLREADDASVAAANALKAEHFRLGAALEAAQTLWDDRAGHLTSAFSTLQANLYAGARGQKLTDAYVEQTMADVAAHYS